MQPQSQSRFYLFSLLGCDPPRLSVVPFIFIRGIFMYVPKDKNMDEMISEHAINRVARMEIGDVTNCIELFGSAVWYSLTDLEKHYLFMRMVDMLVDEGELDLEIAGVNDAGQTLYERIG
jgi:hypothetical protein